MTVSSESTPPIRVRLFARYAELVGRDLIEFSSDRARSVAEVVDLIRGFPGGDAIPARPLVAVNLEQSGPDRAVKAGDEVALLPPLAGG